MVRRPRARSLPEGTRILIVDDEFLIALDLEGTFRDAGAEIVGPCLSLPSARRVAGQEAFDLAILDIRLGRETTESLAHILFTRNIPFFFYSGQSVPEAIERLEEKPIIITKPAAPAVLVETAAELLDRNRSPAADDRLTTSWRS